MRGQDCKPAPRSSTRRGQVLKNPHKTFRGGWKTPQRHRATEKRREEPRPLGVSSCRLCGASAEQRWSQREKRNTESGLPSAEGGALVLPLCPTRRAATKSHTRRRRAPMGPRKANPTPFRTKRPLQSLCLCASVAFFHFPKEILWGFFRDRHLSCRTFVGFLGLFETIWVIHAIEVSLSQESIRCRDAASF